MGCWSCHQQGLCFFFFLSEVDSLLRRWKTHVAEAFMVEIHHHLLPFYSAGSQDRQVSVNRCEQKKKNSNRVRLVLTVLLFKNQTTFHCSTLCNCGDDRCDPTAAGITPA